MGSGENPLTLLRSGEAAAKQDDKPQALALYRRAAEGFRDQGKTVQAMAAFKLMLELVPPDAPSAESIRAELVQVCNPNLPPIPLFSSLTPETLTDLLQQVKRVTFEKGSFVCRQGDIGDSIYVLTEGRVAVRAFRSDGSFQDLAELEAGAFFGELAYFGDRIRQASIEALEPVTLLELERRVLEKVTEKHPEMRQVLEDFSRQRQVDTLLARSELFSSLSGAQRSTLAGEFLARAVPAGNTLIVEGDPGDFFFFIESGQVEVFRETNGRKVLLSRLSTGDFFGELAVLTQARRSASVRTLTDCRFFTLTADHLRSLVQRFPATGEVLKRVAEERLAVTKPKSR